MRYKVGDRVRVIAQFDEDASYPSSVIEDVGFNGAMEEFCGSIVTIKRVFEHGVYFLDEDPDGWSWVESMFDGFADEFDEVDAAKNTEDLGAAFSSMMM